MFVRKQGQLFTFVMTAIINIRKTGSD